MRGLAEGGVLVRDGVGVLYIGGEGLKIFCSRNWGEGGSNLDCMFFYGR